MRTMLQRKNKWNIMSIKEMVQKNITTRLQNNTNRR